MSIKIASTINRIDEKEFHQIDYEVTGIAYAIHNDIGRLWDEKIYQNELANRCRAAGVGNVKTEVPVMVLYKDFCKEYYVDLLVNNSIIYELKTVSRLNAEHNKQALNYLLLLGLKHGKLINFRPASVQKRFVSTTLLPKNRYELTFDDQEWFEFDEDSMLLKELITELLKAWGAYLETSLFYDAICHFRSGGDKIIKYIDVVRDGTKLGKQRIHLLNPKSAFKLTALSNGMDNYERHLRRFIKFTNLDVIQWINFNHNLIIFKTHFSS